MAYTEECPIRAWEKYVFCCFRERILYMSVISSWFIMLFTFSIFLLIFYLFCSLMKVKYRNLQLLVYNYLFFPFCQVLLHVLWDFVKCVYSYILDELVFLSMCIVLLCPHITVFDLQSILSNIRIAIPLLFWFLFEWNSYFFHSLTFNLFLRLKLKESIAASLQ